jgi:polysaccharide biosynthesis/export protein
MLTGNVAQRLGRADNEMMSFFRNPRWRQRQRGFPVVFAFALAAIAFQGWLVDFAAAQSTASKTYRISAGDRIGVTVFGQPDLSGEANVDQGGNIRLPLIGDIHAANLTLTELEKSIATALTPGYVRNPTVTARIVEYGPIYVLGMVRTPGLYPYREGLSVLAAIARAGGIGGSDAQQGAMLGGLLQAEERIRLLEVGRVALLAKRARLIALQKGDERIDFPDMSGIAVDAARIAQVRDSEELAFVAERQALRQETEALEKQLPRLQAEISSLKQQIELEAKQRGLNHELIADYEQLAKSGLARKSTYIEVRREEARIDGNIGRLESDALKAELLIGEVQFKVAELSNNYQRRVLTELRETERSLLDLTVSLPAAQRMRATYARQAGLLTMEQAEQAAITVIRASGNTNVKYAAAVDFQLQPGDIVQVGSLFPAAPDLTPDRSDASGEKAVESVSPLRAGKAVAADPAAGRSTAAVN